jgi:hypothetical protein
MLGGPSDLSGFLTKSFEVYIICLMASTFGLMIDIIIYLLVHGQSDDMMFQETKKHLFRSSLYSLSAPLFVLFLYTWSINTYYSEPSLIRCKDKLEQMGSGLKGYKRLNKSFLSLMDIKNSGYDNWGKVIATLGVDDKNKKLKQNKINNYMTCPYLNTNKQEKSDNPDYWWADLSNKDCFPKQQLGPSVDPKTPIAGDAPNNHGTSYPPFILLYNGEVRQAGEKSKLWKRAYGSGGCLQPPGSD